MKKAKIVMSIVVFLLTGLIGIVLASNKARINRMAEPEVDDRAKPVRITTVTLDTLQQSFRLSGTTLPLRETRIASEVQGKLLALFVKNGDRVQAGQPIALLDASVLQAQLKSMDASIAKAQADLRRFIHLSELGGASVMQVENAQLQLISLQADKQSLLDQIRIRQIRAPFSGRIENVTATIGSFVSFGTPLCDIIDNSRLKVNVGLSEREAFLLKNGQRVLVQSAVLDSLKQATVTAVSDRADASGKFSAEISLRNSEQEGLRAGMLVDILFSEEKKQAGLTIPSAALVGSLKDAAVFVVHDNQVYRKNLKAGRVISDRIQVLAGLQAGDSIVVSGQINIAPGDKVSVISQ